MAITFHVIHELELIKFITTTLLALTITGTVYGWGDNRLGQACPQFPLAVCSIPKPMLLPIGEVASDIAAINDQVQ